MPVHDDQSDKALATHVKPRQPKVTTHDVVWEPQPRQRLLIQCPVEDILFGGARGGGKTDGILGDWISHQDEFGKHAKGIIFRRTLDELEEVQARAEVIFPAVGGVYKQGKRTWYFPNGARLKMRYLDRDEDANRYQGHSYTWIAFEELTQWPDPTPIDKLRACLRSGAAPVRKSFRATANPGGAGHNWVKARYIDPAPPLTPFYHEDPDTGARTHRVFIPSLLEDNHALTENDPEYWMRVAASAAGNMALLKAWRNGDWDIVAGGMFDDVFDRKRHVLLASFPIPKSWRINRSFDWGSSRPFSVAWWAESDGTTAPNGKTYPRGTIFRIYEWYGCSPSKHNTGLKLTATQIAVGIVEREKTVELLKGRTVHPGPADTSIFDAENGVCMADDMAKKGVRWLKADKRPGSRKNGWERLRKMLLAAKGPVHLMEDAGFFIFPQCVHWLRTVPVLPRDEKNPDDVNTKAEDHAADETRYRIMEPAPKKFAESPQSHTIEDNDDI